MKPLALVTGASSGIGEAISRMMCDNGWEVYGIGRDFSKSTLKDVSCFTPFAFDLLDSKALNQFLFDLPADRLKLLVNNAGCAWYGPHETLSAEKTETMCRLNLELPMKLCGTLLRPLRTNKGTIINIASITALSTSTHGAVYGALKAGLLHFSRTLFEENRKAGLKVTVILPDMTDTQLYRNADFEPSHDEGCSLNAEDIANAIQYVLSLPEGSLISELTVRPQFHRIIRK